MFASREARFIAITLLSLLLICGWEATGWDLPAAAIFADGSGFQWDHHWFFNIVMHSGAKWVDSFLLAIFCMGLTLYDPRSVFVDLSAFRRGAIVLGIAIAALTVAGVKRVSNTSCPWDLAQFGGTVPYVVHWASGIDGGPGHCFPAGHASVGFSWLAAYFALLPTRPLVARRVLWGALAAGLVLGLAQQARGAHFMSHTLWTGWICWAVAGSFQMLVDRLEPLLANWRALRSRDVTSL